MRGHGLAGPYGADFAGGVIANGENKIHLRSARLCEFIPTLAAKIFHRNARQLNLPQRLRTDYSRWMAARAIGDEVGPAFPIENRFGHDRTRGISRAQEKDVVVFLHRDSIRVNA